MELIIKATVILLIAFAATAALRRASAAMRHLVWLAAFACLLILPLVPALPGPVVLQAETTIVVVPSAASAALPTRHLDWLLIIWAVGAVLIGSRTIIGLIRFRRIVRSSTAFSGALVRRSPAVDVPIAFGLLRPVILLPEAAVSWPAEKLRNVVAHEMAHIQRRDWLAHLAAQLTCALYWFHPLVWLAAAGMAGDRERACDDRVLATGVQPSSYAAQLLEFAGASALPAAIGMAGHAGSFELRVRAILDPRVDRRTPARRHALFSCTAALALLAALAGVRAIAQTTQGALTGTVTDVSGAAIPAAVVTISDDKSAAATTTADDGTFSFATVPAGKFTIEIEKPGFETHRESFTGGRPQQIIVALGIGPVYQNLEVVGSVPAPSAPAEHTTQRARVGGNVQPARLLEHVNPAYPQDLQQQGIEGTVLIRAVISTDGHVLSPTVVNSANKELADAALDAVRQWRYAPVLLNGEPIEAVTTITVNFALPHPANP